MNIPTGLKLARNVLAGWVTGRPRLTQCDLHLTFRCNLSCRYCNYPRLAGDELSTAQWFEVVDGLSETGCRRVDVTGGEPLLRPDLADIIGRVRDRGMACVVASNGRLVPARIRDLDRANTLILSLDSLGPAHDRVRGRGALDAALAALDAARSVGLPVKLNAVMTIETISGLDDLLNFSRSRRVPISINLVRSGNPELWNKADELRLVPEETRKILRRLADESRRNSWLLFSRRTYLQAARWTDYAVDFQDESNAAALRVQKPGPRCQAGRYHLSLLPDGRTAPCTMRMKAGPHGNAAAEGLEAAWKKLHGHTCLDCYSLCKLEQNYLYSGDLSVLLNFVRKHLPRVT